MKLSTPRNLPEPTSSHWPAWHIGEATSALLLSESLRADGRQAQADIWLAVYRQKIADAQKAHNRLYQKRG